MRSALRTLRWIAILAVLTVGVRPASAVSVVGPAVSDDGSGPGLLSFNLDVLRGSFTAAVVDLEGDLGPLPFSVAVFNLLPQAFSSFDILLGDGAAFSVVGDVTNGFDTFFPNITSTPTTARIVFSPDQDVTLAGFEIGDPFELTGATNWVIEVSDVPDGIFSIGLDPVLVPEPGTVFLLILGLASLAHLRRRLVR